MPAPNRRTNARSRGLCSLLVCAICLGAAGCRSGKEAAPDPPKETGKLEQLIGKWRSKTQRFARNVNGLGGEREFTFECKWTLDKYYVACTQVAEANGQTVKETDVFGYSGQAGLYSMMVVLDVGNLPPQVYTDWFTMDNQTWHFFARRGTRSTWVFKSPDYHVTSTERSVDGIHWEVSSSGEHVRIR